MHTVCPRVRTKFYGVGYKSRYASVRYTLSCSSAVYLSCSLRYANDGKVIQIILTSAAQIHAQQAYFYSMFLV